MMEARIPGGLAIDKRYTLTGYQNNIRYERNNQNRLRKFNLILDGSSIHHIPSDDKGCHMFETQKRGQN